MQRILTPSGYRDIADCAVGDEVSAFDVGGGPIVNTIEGKRWVDTEEWVRWWNVEPVAPPFQFFRINGTWILNSEQSIWRNGANVCHAKHLVVGDVLHDGSDNDVTITSIEEVTAEGWWHFDISGDHSYIADGLTFHNASRFWVGGTGTLDSSTTTHWSATSGGAGGASVPGSADTATFNGSSGGGTVTLNFGGSITWQQLSVGSFTGTWDNSANNNNMTLSSASSAFDNNGSGTRTINLGSATYTLNGAGTTWDTAAANLTLSATSSTIIFSGTSGTRIFTGAGKNYGTINFSANSSLSGTGLGLYSNAGTTSSLIINTPIYMRFVANGGTYTITSLTCAGTSSNQIFLSSDAPNQSATIGTTGATPSWTAFRDLIFTGSPTASNSFDLGHNSGITITAPGGGGGGGSGAHFSATIF